MRHAAALLACAWLFAVAGPAATQTSRGDAMRFDVPVNPKLERYAFLFAHPAYAAIAMESAGVPPSAASRVRAVNGQTIEFCDVVLRHAGSKGAVHDYEAGLRLPGRPAGQGTLALPIRVDATTLAQGRVSVVVSLPLAGLLPAEVADKIRFKAQYSADEVTQGRVLAYLDELSQRAPAGTGAAGVLEAIALDAYNRRIGPAAPG
ncbi:MAG: hypothetical protein FJX53_14175, partial [Alphaproteobacteria bacterium]|nr:hypothetical protein [Alphaproteobacteria bacterium]